MKSFFVSSTFRDMQEERDIIHRIVFPSIRNRLKEYGENVEEVDLRWGVDTLNLSEEESGHMVIQVCIDAIDRCVPYFIVLLGERYGWIPEESLFDGLQDNRLDAFDKNVSITEMEIRYGTLDQKICKGKCIFCFRDPTFISQIPAEYQEDYISESDEHRRKLARLKKVILDEENLNIIEYKASWDAERNCVSGLESFAELLEEKLMEVISKDGLEKRELEYADRISQNAKYTMQQYMSTYVNRVALEMYISAALLAKGNRWLIGEAGSGKTAFLTQMALRASEANINNLVYYAGNPGCESVDVFLEWLVYELEKNSGRLQRGIKGNRRLYMEKLESLLKELKETIILFMDAIDQMEPEIIWVLVQLSLFEKQNASKKEGNFKLIVTANKKVAELGVKEAQEFFNSQKISGLTDAEAEAMIMSVAGRRGKSLDAKVKRKIRSKESMHNPMCLSLLLQRLFMMDAKEFAEAEKLAKGMDGISLYMQKIVEEAGDSLQELTTDVIQKVCDTIKNVDAREILGILAVAPEGVSIRTLLEMNPDMSPIYVEQLLFFLYDLLKETEEGRWIFQHRIIKQHIRGLFEKECLKDYAERLYEIVSRDNRISLNELFLLGKEINRFDLGEKIANALETGTVDELEIWNILQRFDTNEMGDYLVNIMASTTNDEYCSCLFKGIVRRRISLSNNMERCMELADVHRMASAKSRFYFYGAKSLFSKVMCDKKTEEENMDEQYAIYAQMEIKEKDIIWDMAQICIEGCCLENLEKAKKWHGRLEKVVGDLGKRGDDVKRYVLLNEAQIWYWKFHQWKETKEEAVILEIITLLNKQYSIYNTNQKLNIYAQEDPDYTRDCMNQIVRFCQTLGSILIKKKQYAAASSYTGVVYAESLKDYQTNRNFDSAMRYAHAAVWMMHSTKDKEQERYYQEAERAIEWLEGKYYCRLVGEYKNSLHNAYAGAIDAEDICEKAMEAAKKLCDSFPDCGYEELVIWDLMQHSRILRKNQEHLCHTAILNDLKQIEVLSEKMWSKTSDGYFQDISHGNYLDLTEQFLCVEELDSAEAMLEKALKYLQCDYIQNGDLKWIREIRTALTGAKLYYRAHNREKTLTYIQWVEELLTDCEERNKYKSRREHSIAWEGLMLHMRARILWEVNRNPQEVKLLIEKRIKLLEPLQNRDDLQESYLLLGEVELFEGKTEEGIKHLKMLRCTNDERKVLGYDIYLLQDRLWKYIISAKASVMLHEETKEDAYMMEGLDICVDIIRVHTLERRLSYRPEVEKLLMENFAVYGQKMQPLKRAVVSEILLDELITLSKERELEKEEKELLGEVLIYKAGYGEESCKLRAVKGFDYFYHENEYNEVLKWLNVQKQKWPDELKWNDRINRIILKQVLWKCLGGNYQDALQDLKHISPGENAEWAIQKEIMYELCEKRIIGGKSGKMNISDSCKECLSYYIQEERNVNNWEYIPLYMYIELLLLAGDSSSCEEAYSFYKKAAVLLEEKVLKGMHTKPTFIWKRILELWDTCSKYAKEHMDRDVYKEECRKAIHAYAEVYGMNGEHELEILRRHGDIAKAYDGFDEKEAWNIRKGIAESLKIYQVRKGKLSQKELLQCLAYYEILLEKAAVIDGISYSEFDVLIQFPSEVMIKLYEMTTDSKWLEGILKATDAYRKLLTGAKNTGQANNPVNNKIADSYLFDLDVYSEYLKKEVDISIIKRIENLGREIIACIPEGYSSQAAAFVEFFSEVDEIIEGKSLEIKAYVQVFADLIADNKDAFWGIQKLMAEKGVEMSTDEIIELFNKQQHS